METKLTTAIRVNSKTYTVSRKKDAEIAGCIVGMCSALMNTKWDKVRREEGLVNCPNFVAVPNYQFAFDMLCDIARFCNIPTKKVLDIVEICVVDLNS